MTDRYRSADKVQIAKALEGLAHNFRRAEGDLYRIIYRALQGDPGYEKLRPAAQKLRDAFEQFHDDTIEFCCELSGEDAGDEDALGGFVFLIGGGNMSSEITAWVARVASRSRRSKKWT